MAGTKTSRVLLDSQGEITFNCTYGLLQRVDLYGNIEPACFIIWHFKIQIVYKSSVYRWFSDSKWKRSYVKLFIKKVSYIDP